MFDVTGAAPRAKTVMFPGLLVTLSQPGIQLGPVLAGLGIAGFIVAFALQDTLSNFAAGLMILIYRPYDVGDAVEAGGVMGTVKAMTWSRPRYHPG
jgi:small conductance mechanosensitive channel